MSATTSRDTYRGPERRRHKVLVTDNSEYHCRDGTCVAVRSLRTGEFMPDHHAIGCKLGGSMKLTENGVAAASPPEHPGLGEQLHFTLGNAEADDNIITSALRRIERPARDVVKRYVH
jgi:hypothetical protein